MRKKAIVGRLQYSNELNTIFIDDIALHQGFKVYLKDSVALGKKHGTSTCLTMQLILKNGVCVVKTKIYIS